MYLGLVDLDGILETCWERLEGLLGASWGLLVPSWGLLWARLGVLQGVFGRRSREEATWSHLAAVLGPS